MTSQTILEQLRQVHEQGPFCKSHGTFEKAEPRLTQEVKAAYYDRLAYLLSDLFNALEHEKEEQEADKESCDRDGICQLCGQKKRKAGK